MGRCAQNVHVEYTATEEFTSLYPIQPGNFSHGGVPDQEHQDYCAPTSTIDRRDRYADMTV